LPSINRLHREWEPRRLAVLLVNIRESRARVARAVAERGYEAPVVLDLDGRVTDAYGVGATPTAFLIAPDGTLVGRAIGPRPWTGAAGRAVLEALVLPGP
jgi:hypothetical protein